MTISNQQAQDAAVIMRAAGFGALGSKPSDTVVFSVLQHLGELLTGVGPLLREVCITAAVGALRISGYCNTTRAEKLLRAAVAQADSGTLTDEASWVTYGKAPGGEVIVDLVQRRGELLWVVAYPPGSRTLHQAPVEIVADVPGRHHWPRPALPWTGIPQADAVEEAWADDDPQRLAFDLTNVFRRDPEPDRHVVLPDPQGGWAALLAIWVMGTYLLDSFNYFPMLLLEGPPARGKTRLGKAAAFLAYRGTDTTTPTPATLFRNRSRHRVSLFLDVQDLPGRMSRSDDIADLLLSSFERDKVVTRVLRPDAPTPPGEQKSFVVYGASVLATNEAVRSDHPLVSRCLRIPMPEAGRQWVRAALRAEDKLVLALRARLIAWAAQVIGTHRELPTVPEGSLSGRLRDIGLPLLQVAQLVRSDYYDVILRLLRTEQAGQRAEAAESYEGKLVTVLQELRAEGLAPGAHVGTEQVLDRLTNGAGLIPRKDPERGLGRLCGSLHLKTKRLGPRENRHRYILYPDDAQWEELCARYGVGTSGVVDPSKATGTSGTLDTANGDKA